MSAEPLIVDFKENPEPYTIESLCVQCGKNGETVLMLTKIPFFKEIMIGSFTCNQCGNRNNEVQFVGQLPSNGLKINFKATSPQDLGREVIKSEHATIYFDELELEIPESKKAQITTIQGIISRIEEQLAEGQEIRKIEDMECWKKIQNFIEKLRMYRRGEVLPFNMKIVDPSGNSNIKNIHAPKLDQHLLFSYPPRTLEQMEKMGYSQHNTVEGQKNNGKQQPMKKKEVSETYQAPSKIDFNEPLNEKNFLAYEPSVFEIDCHSCLMPGQMKMCSTSVPYFTDLVIMSFSCEYCGAHSTQTKNSGEVSDKAITITLNIQEENDLKRDLFKSETCKVSIPEIQLELDYGTLGGVFTTVEGLLQKIKTHLGELNSFTDSDGQFWSKINSILLDLTAMMNFQKKFTLIMRDPLSHSFLQNPFHPEEDNNAERKENDRTQEEMDFLGFDTMQV